MITFWGIKISRPKYAGVGQSMRGLVGRSVGRSIAGQKRDSAGKCSKTVNNIILNNKIEQQRTDDG